MKTNKETIQEVLDYIDDHIKEPLTLDHIANKAAYSKYHLCRMFISMTGCTLHQYIQRRRLTEAARDLVYTNTSIMEIALSSGYETQRSFSVGFKAFYKCSPQVYRKKQSFYPLQLKLNMMEQASTQGNRYMEIKIVENKEIKLIGYRKNTHLGFFVIGKCWHKLHANKQSIPKRSDTDFLIGLNDYSSWDYANKKQPSFTYFAGAEVSDAAMIPKGMEYKELPANNYIVFCFHANCTDSLQPISDYIYKEWFPQSSYILHEEARYDFAKYGEEIDKDGKSKIEYWIPIL